MAVQVPRACRMAASGMVSAEPPHTGCISSHCPVTMRVEIPYPLVMLSRGFLEIKRRTSLFVRLLDGFGSSISRLKCRPSGIGASSSLIDVMGDIQALESRYTFGPLCNQSILRLVLALIALISCGAQFNMTDLSAMISNLPEESCMSLKQLEEAVRHAAWIAPPPFNVSVVMLTTCNLRVSLIGVLHWRYRTYGVVVPVPGMGTLHAPAAGLPGRCMSARMGGI